MCAMISMIADFSLAKPKKWPKPSDPPQKTNTNPIHTYSPNTSSAMLDFSLRIANPALSRSTLEEWPRLILRERELLLRDHLLCQLELSTRWEGKSVRSRMCQWPTVWNQS